MRAVRIHRHGGPETLQVDDIPVPRPGPTDLLVRQRASSINHRDIWIRRGHPHPAYHVDLPAVLGIDICGDVVDAGDRVEKFAPGDRVTANPYMHCGRCGRCARGLFQYCPNFGVYNGAHAEYVLVPESIGIAVSPDIPDEHVASFPNAYITAWQMLVGKAKVTPADLVFIWAGTSGLGNAAIQIAKLAGATVVTSAGSPDKLEALRRSKADLVLDHHAGDLVERVLEFTKGEGASIVFEHIGEATWERSLELCAIGGTIVSAGATSGDDARMNVTSMFVKQVRILGSRLGTMEDGLAAAEHLSAGRFEPLIGAVLPFERAAEAHELLDEGRVVGKVIVKPELE
ncbi:MAG TPA: zinc-binding dehydrogenase [Gaiellaceae bacterium]|nr:zinc-binding dehydrogenase [Gaiellaceae bacterium]